MGIEMRKYLYHYTSIDAFVQILEGQSFKFNNLSKCDDLEEEYSNDLGKIGRLIYVSCWTEEEKESIPMWSQYSGNMRGVRIGMKELPFHMQETILDGKKSIMNTDLDEYNKKNQMMFAVTQPETIIIEYTDEARLLYPDIISEPTKGALKRFANGSDMPGNYAIDLNYIGKYKRKCWEFQKEVRYKVFGTPMGLEELKDINKANPFGAHREYIRRVIDDQYPVPYDSIFLGLTDDAISSMEIVFGPRMTKSDEILLQGFLESKNLGNNWRKSSLKIR